MKTVAALFLIALLLALPSGAHALPFVPDSLDATSLESRFVETGTNTACVNCEDLDPTNDLTLTLDNFGALGFGGFGYAYGFMAMTGFLESIRDADLTIEYDLRVVSSYGIGSSPEELAAYPLPSVTYGTVSGFIQGGNFWQSDDFDVVEDCCNGVAGGAFFLSAFGPSHWSVEQINGNGGIAFNGDVQWAEMPYTPEVTAVPEPTTMLLLGSGLIGAAWKRRRRH